MEFTTVKVSHNLNLMSNMSTQRNQQLSRCVFSKVIECLEQNTRKQIDCKRPTSTKQMNRVQNIPIKICKYKYNQVRLVLAALVSTCLY